MNLSTNGVVSTNVVSTTEHPQIINETITTTMLMTGLGTVVSKDQLLFKHLAAIISCSGVALIAILCTIAYLRVRAGRARKRRFYQLTTGLTNYQEAAKELTLPDNDTFVHGTGKIVNVSDTEEHEIKPILNTENNVNI
uniref:Uncharacterized LOC113474451 n=1 Tax=Ciona intestinalis TaxID=7719 RepID=F6V5J5_CIOIN|nr:uncharacterized protein LOC113474451 [Ciona intestinalis]|eukprot:XP_026691393.1 uncharacterized protein LOC113474451 [Ciona intestinalis]